ncbi:MAG TPA: translation initiation factor IF-2 N-terminal domain-containing protein, partial [Limnochordia bacterium]|nr:translation initiation factor IF-2 N-terminal domain-containing protein [Limnochordia bacterium]
MATSTQKPNAQRPQKPQSPPQNSARTAENARRTEGVPDRGEIEIPDAITVKEFAERLGVPPTALIKNLMLAGIMAAINQSIEHDAAARVAQKLGFRVVRPEQEDDDLVDGRADKPDELLTRPPVVTIMGHVDHGKTTLLDAIRQTRVAEGEAGGITQHIGAYQVTTAAGKPITFLDTPGHEAFTQMRSRGAQVTDIAILVVAADDGVMPQTIEAINHAKAAKVPIIIAVNKMDRPGANPDRVKQQLTEHELVPEEWGGDTICVNVSAVQKQGIEELLEMILLVAEMRELTANPNRAAKGAI